MKEIDIIDNLIDGLVFPYFPLFKLPVSESVVYTFLFLCNKKARTLFLKRMHRFDKKDAPFRKNVRPYG